MFVIVVLFTVQISLFVYEPGYENVNVNLTNAYTNIN
jgi:hypothetical protein